MLLKNKLLDKIFMKFCVGVITKKNALNWVLHHLFAKSVKCCSDSVGIDGWNRSRICSFACESSENPLWSRAEICLFFTITKNSQLRPSWDPPCCHACFMSCIVDNCVNMWIWNKQPNPNLKWQFIILNINSMNYTSWFSCIWLYLQFICPLNVCAFSNICKQ